MNIFTASLGPLLLLASATAQTLHYSSRIVQDQDSKAFGRVLVDVGDVDGDGRPDLAVGAPGVTRPGPTAAFGAVYVFSGATRALIQQVTSTQANDEFGASICGVGDIDGDGRDDFVVGAPAGDVGSARDVGHIYLYRGLAISHSIFGHGNAAGDRFGASIAYLGDTDGDGRGELVVGSPLEEIGSVIDIGKIHTYRIDTNPLRLALLRVGGGNFAGDQFATDMLATDINGDGLKDLVVSSPLGDVGPGDNRGQVHVYFSGAGGGSRHMNGNVAGERFGTSIAAGDFDADGKFDLLVGSAGYGAAGRVQMFAGSNGNLMWNVIGSFRSIGERMSALQDVNGDAVSDFMLAEFHLGSTPSWQFHVYLGGRGQPITSSYFLSPTVFLQPPSQIWYGLEVSQVGIGGWDADSDGLHEPIVATWAYLTGTASTTTRGNIYVHDHPTTGSIPAVANVTASTGYCGRTRVGWNGLGGLVGFELLRDGVAIATAGPHERSIQDTTAPTGPHGYSVRGVTSGRVGPPSTTANGEAYVCFESYPGGCPGVQGTPLLSGLVEPVFGGTLRAQVTNIGASSVGAILMGFSDSNWSGVALPLEATPFGFPGCLIVTSIDATIAVAGQGGTMPFAWRIPGSSTFLGLRLYLQAANADASRPGGFAFSNGLRLRIGRPLTLP